MERHGEQMEGQLLREGVREAREPSWERARWAASRVAVIIMAIGLLAALGPARCGLAVQPTEALREE